MRRSRRSNVVTWLTSKAFGVRSLAAVKPTAFRFCAVRLAIPFARLSDRLDAQNAQIVSDRVLSRRGWSDVVFAFHDREEIGPRNARLAPTALFSHEPGATPQECDRTKNEALKARDSVSRAFSARVLLIHGTWGACPRLASNAAPLALSKYADRIQGAAPGDWLAANCWLAQSHCA